MLKVLIEDDNYTWAEKESRWCRADKGSGRWVVKPVGDQLISNLASCLLQLQNKTRRLFNNRLQPRTNLFKAGGVDENKLLLHQTWGD